MSAALETVKKILDDIKSGRLSIFWESWFFSGGRTYGEGHEYAAFNSDGNRIYSILLNERNGLTIKTDCDTICFELDDEDVVKTADEILYYAVIRDDKELIKLLSDKDGEFVGLPRDYDDISRRDVIEGRWSINYMLPESKCV